MRKRIITIVAAAMVLMVFAAACGSSGGATETKKADSNENQTAAGKNEIDQQLSEAFEDVFSIMTNDSGWVTGGNDFLSQFDEMKESMLEGVNGGEDFDVSGIWNNDSGMVLTVAAKEDGTYDWKITQVEGDLRKTWSFIGGWDKVMGGMSYDGCVYSEAPATGDAEADAAPISSDGRGTVTYSAGELIWKILADGQEDGEPVAFHR